MKNSALIFLSVGFFVASQVGCDHQSISLQSVAGGKSIEAEREAKNRAAKYEADTAGIDWSAYVKGFSRTTFFSKMDGFTFTKYAPYKLVGASRHASVVSQSDGTYLVVASVILRLKGQKEEVKDWDLGVEYPKIPDPTKELFESFTTQDPIRPGTPRYIREAIIQGRLAIGMTPDQVVIVRGHPDSQNNSVSSYGTSGLWIYRSGGYSYHIYFINGRVDSVSSL